MSAATQGDGMRTTEASPSFPRYLVEHEGARRFRSSSDAGAAIRVGGRLRMLVLEEGLVVRNIKPQEVARLEEISGRCILFK